MATRCGVVLFLVLAVVLAQAPTASAAGGAARFVPPYNVCTSDWAPIVSGSPSGNCEHSQQPGLKAGTAINTRIVCDVARLMLIISCQGGQKSSIINIAAAGTAAACARAITTK